MNVYEALESMRQGIAVKTKKGLQGNSTSIFTTNSISIIFEKYINSKGNKEEKMFSVRNYECMFDGCTSLTTAPDLPATTLATQCYRSMFEGCTSIVTAPELPATELAKNCYNNMFRSCSSLTTTPELYATTLTDYCYFGMFYDCTSLNHIKCLATDISATDCTTGWVEGVASTGTFVKHPDMNDWTTGISSIPEGWAVENYAEQ